MKDRSKFILVAFSLLNLMAFPAEAQNSLVKLRFEVDSKRINCRSKLTIFAGELVISPTVSKGGFQVPREIQEFDKVGVTILCNRYKVSFRSVYLSKFQTDWIVGIDTRPFNSENLPTILPEKMVSEIHFIRFQSEKGDGTIITTEIQRQN